MRDPRLCHARSKQSGKLCRNFGIPKGDGTSTKTCRFHGGGHELRAPGDPARGGRPPETFSYVRSVPVEFKEAYAAALREVGKLEHEIALARTNLLRLQLKYEAEPKGGIPLGAQLRRPYAEIVGAYLDRISRLEARRARLLASPSGASDFADVDRVLDHLLEREAGDGD